VASIKVQPNEWTTGDEIKFIKETVPKEVSRLEFLNNYKEALCSREKWDAISKTKVIKCIESEINKEIKGA